jgi:hypothetical protein
MLLITCQMAFKDNPRDFEKVLELKGSKRPWFSIDASQLRNPARIRGTKLFVETNWNANGTVLVCLQVLQFFGIRLTIKIQTD